MLRSIKTKLIVIYAAVILVVMAVSGTFMLLTVRNMEQEHTEMRLRHQADAIYSQIVQQYDRADFGGAAEWGILGQSEYLIESLILSADGLPIAPAQFIQPDLRFNDSAVIAAIGGQEHFSARSIGISLDGVEQQWLTFAKPVVSDGETFIIFVRQNASWMNESLARLTFTLIITVLIALVVTVILWLFLGNVITRPILTLTRHARAIAEGDLNREIEPEGDDEIGQLSLDFRYMATQLGNSLSSMASEKNKLEAFLQNTSHGVLAYDAMGTLAHANHAGHDLLPGVEFEAARLADVLGILQLQYDEVMALVPGDLQEATCEYGEYMLSACITPYTSQAGEVDGYVIVLQDITRQTKLDNMRKEFVANVSHELRTPLTSIRTYAETLLEGAMDDKETAHRFLSVIEQESRRMTLLVSDLLELSRIDAKGAMPETEIIDLAAILRLSIRQSHIAAEQQQQRIEFDAPATPCLIDANAARVNQVIYNILSNSIKYSPENTTITIGLDATKKFFHVNITDQGIGIPQEDLSRIFERFYRVDKARARAMGGTGLGLAIVKEIMEEHGGRVYAMSKPGEGTTMMLRFNRMGQGK